MGFKRKKEVKNQEIFRAERQCERRVIKKRRLKLNEVVGQKEKKYPSETLWVTLAHGREVYCLYRRLQSTRD